MGLDWVVAGKPLPGHEEEVRRLSNGPWDQTKADWRQAAIDRLGEISIGSYETLGAPRVGIDVAATAYMRRIHAETKPDVSEAEWLRQKHGAYVLELVPPCAGLPRYVSVSDPTAFRGAFLPDAAEILGEELLVRAWGSMEPPELLRYGRALLRRAELAAKEAGLDVATIEPSDDEESVEHKLHVVREAGRWCVFWAERGHGMIADF